MIVTERGTDVFAAALAELAFAHEHVPFWKHHLTSAGLTLDSVRTPADFRNVPPTRKQHYREHFPAGVLARGTTLNDPDVELARSSGRTGDRLTTARRIADRRQRGAVTLGIHPLALARSMTRREPMIVYGPPNCSDVDCANPLRSIEDRTLPRHVYPMGILAIPVAHDMTVTPERMTEQGIREIKEFGATTAIIAGSHASWLIRSYKQRHLPPPPLRFGFGCFTQLTELARAHWREFFNGAPLVNVYNMTEFGSIAAECPKGRMHVNTESYYAELIREDGTPARQGDLAELLITSIGDRLSPHVRYATGDFFRVLDGCTCGSPWPVVTLEGRRFEFLSRPDGGFVTPGDVSRGIGAPEGVDLYQVVQTAAGHLRMGLLTNSSYKAGIGDELVERLRALFGNVPITVQVESYLPCEKSGKFLYCRSEAAH
jgi:phenylacetate-CoA ligase